MPHLRARFLEPLLRKDLTWSPVVSVLGMRQVGKTTHLKSLGKSYLSLDDESLRSKWEAGDWSLLESSRKPVVVDEAHMVGEAGRGGILEALVSKVEREREKSSASTPLRFEHNPIDGILEALVSKVVGLREIE